MPFLLFDEAIIEHIPSDGDAYVDVARLGAIMVQVGADDECRYAAHDGEFFQMGEGRELPAIVCLARFVGEDGSDRHEGIGFESRLQVGVYLIYRSKSACDVLVGT